MKTITFFGDIICPYTYPALASLYSICQERKEEWKIDLHSFLLHKPTSEYLSKGIYYHIAHNYQVPLEKAEKIFQEAEKRIVEADLPIETELIIPSDPRLAHQLFLLAKEEGKGVEVFMALQRAYFAEGKELSDTSFLREIALAYDLPAEKVEQVLNEASMQEALEAELALAKWEKIASIPTAVFPSARRIDGYRSREVYEKEMEK